MSAREERSADKANKQPHLLIGRNPNPASRLPFVLSIPIAGEAGPLVLATSDLWPGPRDLFCYQLAAWPDGAEVLDSVPVEACWRAGPVVHLILARRAQRRSLFVWTRRRGRTEEQPVQTLIFWRSQESMRAARPGIRVPAARGLDQRPVTIAVDTHERYPWRFPGTHARTERRELPVGDYGIFFGNQLVAAIERKSVRDLAAALTGGRLGFQLAELSRLPRAALVVEGRLSDLVKLQKEQKLAAGWLLNTIAALQVEHPRVSWVFAENRAIAQDFAYRWLVASVQALRDRRGDVVEPAVVAGGDAVTVAGGDAGAVAETRANAVANGPGTNLWRSEVRRSEAVRLARAGQIWTVALYKEYFQVSAATAQNDLSSLVKSGQLQIVERPPVGDACSPRGRRPRSYAFSERLLPPPAGVTPG